MNIDEIRKVVKTAPKQNIELKTEFFEGVRGITVKLIDYPTNPYKVMVEMALSTWGDTISKWKDLSPESRFWVVKAVLDFKSLPNAMESFSFSFAVEKCSRSAFDQIARARIGAVFSSMGWRDNEHSDIGFRVPQSIWDNPLARKKFYLVCLGAKGEYHRLVKSGQSSWQDARALLPISALHNFSCAFNYMALRNFCGNRLKFCEQADTVAVAWLMREKVKEKFSLLANYLRPSCDWGGICQYHQNNTVSGAFGCLFKECRRNKCLAIDNYATFNYACSDKKMIERQLEIKIPSVKEDMAPEVFGDLSQYDKDCFIDYED